MNEPSQRSKILGGFGVVDRVAVRAILCLERQQLGLRQLAARSPCRALPTVSGRFIGFCIPTCSLLLLVFRSLRRCSRTSVAGALQASPPAARSPRRNRRTRCGASRLSMQWSSKRVLGQHQVGAARDAEVGAAIADHYRQLARRPVGEAAFAVAGQRPAIAPRMRERSVASGRRRATAGDWRSRARRGRGDAARLDRAIEPVRDHDQRVAETRGTGWRTSGNQGRSRCRR